MKKEEVAKKLGSHKKLNEDQKAGKWISKNVGKPAKEVIGKHYKKEGARKSYKEDAQYNTRND